MYREIECNERMLVALSGICLEEPQTTTKPLKVSVRIDGTPAEI
jgi:hypothetical protein